MKRIFKYPIEITDEQKIDMPQGAQILSAQMQNDKLCLWAAVDDNFTSAPIVIRVLGTGHPVPDIEGLRYIGTAQDQRLGLVWHVFEK